ncbi:uncharacterized protein prr33 isoform X2 [Rhinoraja longicauda]
MLLTMKHYCASPRTAPPPAPKPGKDNARLQKIRKRIAKRQSAEILSPEDGPDKSHSYLSKPFRASLSPVSEGNPDLEHSERRVRALPYLPSALPSLRQHLIPAVVKHGVSLYPIRKTFYKGKIEILTKTETSGSREAGGGLTHVSGPPIQPVVPVKTFFLSSDQPSSSPRLLPMLGLPPLLSTSCYMQSGTEIPTANISTGQSAKPLGLALGDHLARPYLANGPNVAMMSVFQSSRATYEPPRVKTPTYDPPRVKTPTYDLPSLKTPTYDPPRVKTPTYDPPRVKTPTYEHRGARTPTYDPPRVKTPTYEPPRVKTPTYEPPRVKTPTYDLLRVKTPTNDPLRSRTPTYEPLRVKTPTYDPPKVKTPTYDPLRARIPTFELRWVKTPTYEPLRVNTPTFEPLRVKTPTYEPSRARTPTYEPPRVKTPTFEIPRDKTFTHGVPHGGLTDMASDIPAMQKNAPTPDTVSANVEVHHQAIITLEGSKVESEPKPPHSVAETANQEGQSVLKAAAPLKTVDRVKPPRSKISGWSRLKKHMVVEDEPPEFPEPESESPKPGAQEQSQNQTEDGKQESQNTKGSRADKMWNAMLFQMFAMKEHLTEGSRQEQQEPSSDTPGVTQRSSWFSSRLPLLLFRPRFDARKLKEAAKGPLKRISSTLIESGLHRKAIDDEELKDFNRTAKGWPAKALA